MIPINKKNKIIMNKITHQLRIDLLHDAMTETEYFLDGIHRSKQKQINKLTFIASHTVYCEYIVLDDLG